MVYTCQRHPCPMLSDRHVADMFVNLEDCTFFAKIFNFLKLFETFWDFLKLFQKISKNPKIFQKIFLNFLKIH